MRLTPLVLAPFLALAIPSLETSAAGQLGGGLSIRVQAGSWGNASVQDIEAVLHSVARALRLHSSGGVTPQVLVRFSTMGPRVLERKSQDGAHVVLLNVQDRRWDQFAYQFSHELCHVLTNYDRRPIGESGSREHQWFEETLCEVVSLVALDRLASSWAKSPPHPGWEEYAPAFREYAARLRAAPHRAPPERQPIASWYVEHEHSLANNPYEREKNEALAAALLEVFSATPGALEAIAYLNLEPPSKGGFAAYLAAWHDCCPEQHRPFVRRLMLLFETAA